MGFMLRQGLADDTRLALEVRPGREGTLKLQSPYWAEAPKSITSVPYPDYYETIRLARSYDLRLLDGALIQLQYEFDAKRNLRRSVQRFLPAPDLLPYQTSPDLYLRDDRQFERGDEFDLHRRFDHHLSFGHGVHFCLGAALARLEGRVALDEVLHRFPRWEVDWDRAVQARTSTVRGWETLPVVVSG